MSSITGRDPYQILMYPTGSILQPGGTSPNMVGFVQHQGNNPLLANVQGGIPVSNAVMSGALPFYEKNAMNIGTLDYLDAMKRSGMQMLNPPPAFSTPLQSYILPEPPKSKNWLYWLIGGIVALIIIGLLLYFYVIKKR